MFPVQSALFAEKFTGKELGNKPRSRQHLTAKWWLLKNQALHIK
jgi:hypothetical protein